VRWVAESRRVDLLTVDRLHGHFTLNSRNTNGFVAELATAIAPAMPEITSVQMSLIKPTEWSL